MPCLKQQQESSDQNKRSTGSCRFEMQIYAENPTENINICENSGKKGAESRKNRKSIRDINKRSLKIPDGSSSYKMSKCGDFDRQNGVNKIQIQKEDDMVLIELLNFYFFWGFLTFIASLNLSCLFILPYLIKQTIKIDQD
jgi:hypothetical protein